MKKLFYDVLDLLLIIALSSSCSSFLELSQNKSVSPLDYGLKTAKTGVERYYVLLKTYQEAGRQGKKVNYEGIKSIDLEIPKDAITIQILGDNDFSGVVFNVLNNSKDFFLFTMSSPAKKVVIPPISIDKGDFSNIAEIRRGNYIVSVSDDNPWVVNRIGYNHGHVRKDVFLVRDGKGSNLPVMPYNNENSRPQCVYSETDLSEKVLKNLKFNRLPGSTQKTYLFQISRQNNVIVENITITTPSSADLTADRVISAQDCTNLTFKDISVDGTYSLSNKYGYAFLLNNIWNYKAIKVKAVGNWGVYGDNNINKATLENCNLNRFDIHCYGRDIKAVGCRFSSLYNQFSSVYGIISFEDCIFTNFTPVLIESAYNAYTPFDLLFKNCTFNLDNRHISIMTLRNVPKEPNIRPELFMKNLPNISLQDCVINVANGVKNWYIINSANTDTSMEFGHIKEIKMKHIVVNSESAKMSVFSKAVNTSNKLKINQYE